MDLVDQWRLCTKVKVLLKVDIGKEARREEPVHHQAEIQIREAQLQRTRSPGARFQSPTSMRPSSSQRPGPCKYLDRRCAQGHKDSCSLCLGAHPPYLCPRARCNQGPGSPNWAIYEKKKARGEGRAPCYEQQQQQQPSQPPPPPPAPAQQDPAPAEAAPLCAAAAAMHPQLNVSSAAPSVAPASCSTGLSKPMQPPGPSSVSSAMGIAQVCLQILTGPHRQYPHPRGAPAQS